MSKVRDETVPDPVAEYQRKLDRIKIRCMTLGIVFAVAYACFQYLYPPAVECRAKGGSYDLSGNCTKLVVVPVD